MSQTIVQNIPFPGVICRKSALDWSADNKISVCTNKGVYILSSYCSPVETGFPLPLHKQVIVAPTETLDFKTCPFLPVPKAINQLATTHSEILCPVILDRTLIPDPTEGSPFLGYRCAKWSPKGAAGAGRCILATLTMDHRLILYQEKGKEWIQVCDLSEMLHSLQKSSWKEKDEKNKNEIILKNYNEPELMAGGKKRRRNDDILLDISPDFLIEKVADMKEKTYNLAAMEMTWTNMFGSPPTSTNDSNYEWCYLIVAMKSGLIVWWKVSPSEGKMVSLAHSWDSKVGLVTSLCWQQTTPFSGFLMCGAFNGQLTFTPVNVLTDEEGPKLAIKPMHKLWDELDRVAVDHIVVLKTSVKKYVIVAAKQSFLVACEMQLTNTAIEIRNVGHATGLHRLPVTGFSVLDGAMPQSHILLSTMEGLVIKIKVTAGQDAIEFQHEPLDLDIDLKNMMVQGLGVSTNGVLCAMILNTAVWFDHLQIKEPLRLVMFVTKTFDEVFSDFSRVLKPQFLFLPESSASVGKYVDYFECARISLSSGEPVPELFDTNLKMCKDNYEQLTQVELHFMRFLLKCFISKLAVSTTIEKEDLEPKVLSVESIIMRNYVSKVLSCCQDKLDLLTPAQGQSLLLMVDWLCMEYKMPVQNKLYIAFGIDCPEDVDSIPARETCRICKRPVKLENLTYGQCDRNHRFGRCCQSLLLCDVIPYHQCVSCKCIALQDVWNFGLNCTYCCLPMN